MLSIRGRKAMYIRKCDFDRSRRFPLEKTATGLIGAGVLSSLRPLIGSTGKIGKDCPEELQALDAYGMPPAIQAIFGLGT